MAVLRITALCPLAFAVVSFAFSLVLLLAGSRPGYLNDDFMIALNSSKLGQNIIRFEPATSTAAASSATSAKATSSSSPFDFLNPLSTASPLNPNNPNNPLEPILGPLIDNATGAIDGGLQNGMNAIVEAVVQGAGVRDFYNLYIESICEGDTTGTNGIHLTDCSSYDDRSAVFYNISKNLRSNIVIGTTNVSAPFITSLMSTSSSISSTFTAILKTIIASLIVALVGSGLTFLLGLPAILFGGSKVLIYALVFSSSLAYTFQLLAAILVTALIGVIVTVVNSIGESLGLFIKQGGKLLLLAWLAWAFASLAGLYWLAVWFVEVRSWSFVRRARTRQERENWRNAVTAMLGDLRGGNREARVSADQEEKASRPRAPAHAPRLSHTATSR
ncbi:hypothetical protein BCR34DRAFT_619799 [Clohesyomyces aquaticus]|uniref:Actin cortical patch SUR7/pH-response regulator pali n=1 Tax=Clohesyomyces aquaticus TaxID=1231657 RepID=A0A1Y1YE97_9PLEO|nr:hypothetical protein BCR34DRAFT_619799 [Clohesyomyces aquaticus]